MNSMVDIVVRSGVIVLGILLIRKWAMEKITRKFQYSLWLMIPIYLLLSSFFSIKVPVSFEALSVEKNINKTDSSIGVNYKQDEDLFDYDSDSAKLQIFSKVGGGIEDQNEIIIQEQVSDINAGDRYTTLKELWKSIRLLISFLLFIFFTVVNIIFAIHLRNNRLFYKTVSLDSVLRECLRFSMGVDCDYDNSLVHKRHQIRLGIYLTNNSNAPFLFGRNIYLHPNMIENQEQMHYIILHEFCHFKHGDLFWNILKYFCCALYWFNPFVWIAARYISRDCELACDESVIDMIGIESKKAYGLTLLQLIIEKQKNIGFIIGTTMKGKKSMIKERVLFISRTFNKNRKAALGCLIIAIFLSGCALIHPYAYVQTEDFNFAKWGGQSSRETLDFWSEIQENFFTIDSREMLQTQDETGLSSTAFTENSCYNFIKSDGSVLYYGTTECLQSIHLATGEITRLIDGNIRPGFLEKGYLYYIKYPTLSDDNAGIGRFNLTTQEDEIIISWADELWGCANMYIEGNQLYLEIGSICEAYLLKNDGTVKLEGENQVQNEIIQFHLTENVLSGINFGFINSIINHSIFTILDGKNNELYIYNTKSKMVLTKKNVLGNVLICDQGIIYTTLDGDIMLNSLGNLENDQILFSATETGYFVNYGAYNDVGLYGFWEKGNSVECICITWKGKKEKIMDIPDVRLAIGLNFSAFSDFVAYYKEGQVNIIQLTN